VVENMVNLTVSLSHGGPGNVNLGQQQKFTSKGNDGPTFIPSIRVGTCGAAQLDAVQSGDSRSSNRGSFEAATVLATDGLPWHKYANIFSPGRFSKVAQFVASAKPGNCRSAASGLCSLALVKHNMNAHIHRELIHEGVLDPTIIQRMITAPTSTQKQKMSENTIHGDLESTIR